ncbi:MAG: solute-binding protein [Bilifractor sp.]
MAARDREGNEDSLGYRIALGGIKGVLKILVIIALIMVLIYLGTRAYSLGYEIFDEKAVDTGDGRAVTVTITDDMSVRQIGKLLISSGLLDESADAFVVQELLSGYHGEILPGTYTLRTSMTADDMFPILCQQDDTEQGGNTMNLVSSSSNAE